MTCFICKKTIWPGQIHTKCFVREFLAGRLRMDAKAGITWENFREKPLAGKEKG